MQQKRLHKDTTIYNRLTGSLAASDDECTSFGFKPKTTNSDCDKIQEYDEFICNYKKKIGNCVLQGGSPVKKVLILVTTCIL
jgi:hypothetical protein